MTLLGIELSAVAKLAVRMAYADGHMDASEIAVIARCFSYFDVSEEQARSLISMALVAKEEDAIMIVAAMSSERKLFVTAWLLAVVLADGVVDEREKALLAYYSLRCGLPSLTIEQALQKIKNDQTGMAQNQPRPVSTAEKTDGTDAALGCVVIVIIGVIIYVLCR